MKLNDSKKNNNYFLLTLQNKLCNQKYQSELLKNEKVLTKSCRILNIASFQLLIHQIMKLKRFYLKMNESMTA